MIPTGVLTVTCGSKLGGLDLEDGWLPSSETGGCRHCQVVGNWSGISETGGFRLRIRVVAVSAQWLGVGQVSRRRVVAVFGDGWLPSPPSGWELVWYLGDGWLPSSETGVYRLKSKRKVGKATWISGSSVRPFPGVLCVGGLGLWLSVPVLCVVWSRRLLLALLRCLVSSSGFVSKRGDDPGHRPKDRVFRPWWSK